MRRNRKNRAVINFQFSAAEWRPVTAMLLVVSGVTFMQVGKTSCYRALINGSLF